MDRETTTWPIATIYECTHRGELIRLSVTRFEKDGKAKGEESRVSVVRHASSPS